MNANYILLFAIIFAVIFVAAAIIYFADNIVNSQTKIMKDFEEIKKELLDASNISELKKASERLLELSKSFWHKSHNILLAELNGIIVVKIIELNKK